MKARRPPRRALIFCPGTDRHKIEKTRSLGADGIILDWEDGAALSRKDEARRTTLEALAELDFGAHELIVRVNPIGSALFDDDLRALATAPRPPDALMLPKVESAGALHRLSSELDALEEALRLPQRTLAVLALIETAMGVLRLPEIAGADLRVEALAFGAEDLAGDVGARRTAEGTEVLYARSAVVTAAAAFGLQALDTPWVDLQDLGGLEADARLAAQLGYCGKLAIHPRQVEPIRSVFTPTPAEVAAARRLVQAHEQHQQDGQGVFELDGRMVDMPMVRAAYRVLERVPAARD